MPCWVKTLSERGSRIRCEVTPKVLVGSGPLGEPERTTQVETVLLSWSTRVR
jgi:hypothetical protein